MATAIGPQEIFTAKWLSYYTELEPRHHTLLNAFEERINEHIARVFIKENLCDPNKRLSISIPLSAISTCYEVKLCLEYKYRAKGWDKAILSTDDGSTFYLETGVFP